MLNRYAISYAHPYPTGLGHDMENHYAICYAYAYPEGQRLQVIGTQSVVGSAADMTRAARQLLEACPGADRVEVWPSGHRAAWATVRPGGE